MVFCRRSERLRKDSYLHGIGWRFYQAGVFCSLFGLEDSARLKAAILDGSYATELLPYKEADVLYLDDLFKTKSGFLQDVSNADVKLAFELLDYPAIEC